MGKLIDSRDAEIFLNKQVKIKNLKNNASPNNKAPQKICLFPVTRPTLFFCPDPKVFIALDDKMP